MLSRIRSRLVTAAAAGLGTVALFAAAAPASAADHATVARPPVTTAGHGTMVRLPLITPISRHGQTEIRLPAAGNRGPAAFSLPLSRAARSLPSCYGDGCFNLDPVTQTNCSVGGGSVNGQILSPSQDGNLGTIRLMYSNHCAANWAEADGLAAHVWIEVFNSLGESVIYQPNFNWGYTSMVDGLPPAGVVIYNSNRTAAYCVSQFNGCVIYPPT